MKKIAITGAEGFFGSRLAAYFTTSLGQEFKVLPFSRKDFDITNSTEVLASFQKHTPDYVIHAAALADTRACEANPALSYAINFEGSANIARACLSIGAKMIFISSDQVYIRPGGIGPFSEASPILTSNVYATHKKAAEDFVLENLPDAIILRFPWLYDAPEEGKKTSSNILTNILSSLETGVPLTAPAFEFRSLASVSDLINQVPAIINLPGGVYNVGTKNDLSTYSFYCKIASEVVHMNQSQIAELIQKDSERYKYEPRDFRMSMKKLRNSGISI